MNREVILQAYHQGPEAVVSLFMETFTALEARIQELESRTKKNSKNSHRPPSSDGLQKPVTKSLRGKTGRLTGGQPKHPGYTLHQVETPDHTVRHPVTSCSQCQASLREELAVNVKKRQVFDLPLIFLEVTEHQAERKICPHCLHIEEAAFPVEVKNVVQYGPHMELMAVYLACHQHLSLSRIAEFFQDICHQPISEGTLNTMIQRWSTRLQPIEEELRELALASPVVHCDETGIRNDGRTEWVHTFSTEQVTLQYHHAKRGKEAMDDIGLLPSYEGISVHDGWSSYFKYNNCQHVLCNVHHLRELQGIYDHRKEEWAKDMMDFFLSAKKAKEEAKGTLTPRQLLDLERKYEVILTEGENLHPPAEKGPNTKGRAKQSKAYNLLRRLRLYKDAVLAFLIHRDLPFDNNLAERDIRSIKIRYKISGSFRSMYGAKNYLRIRSVIGTLRKQGKSIFQTLKAYRETGMMTLAPTQ